jgi:hypothetical protein
MLGADTGGTPAMRRGLCRKRMDPRGGVRVPLRWALRAFVLIDHILLSRRTGFGVTAKRKLEE